MDFDSFVLVASTADLREEPTARRYADAIELRIDLAEAPLDQLEDYEGTLPIIATNRVVSEGGDAPADSTRLDRLRSAVHYPAVSAVDLELSTVAEGEADDLVRAAREHDVRVIVSTHDFEATPDAIQMRETLSQAAGLGDLAKLAVTASDLGDVLDLLRVTWELSQRSIPVATMAMGEPGRPSRALAPVFGSRLGYAPISPDRATAPGQYDLETLSGLVATLGID